MSVFLNIKTTCTKPNIRGVSTARCSRGHCRTEESKEEGDPETRLWAPSLFPQGSCVWPVCSLSFCGRLLGNMYLPLRELGNQCCTSNSGTHQSTHSPLYVAPQETFPQAPLTEKSSVSRESLVCSSRRRGTCNSLCFFVRFGSSEPNWRPMDFYLCQTSCWHFRVPALSLTSF